MILFSMKKIFSVAGYFPLYVQSSYVAYTTSNGVSTIIQGDVNCLLADYNRMLVD